MSDPGSNGLLARWQLLVAALADSRLAKGDCAALAAILDRCNDKGEAWPSLGTVAKDAGVSRATATRSVRRLVELKYLDRQSGTRTTSNRYRIGAPGRRTDEPRLMGEPRRTDEPGVGAPVSLGVGAGMSLEPTQLNLPSEPTQERARATGSPALPEWIPAKAWDLWRRHRGKKLTPLAEKLSLRRLADLRGEGHDPVKVIELAVESGWSSFNGRASTLAAKTGAGSIPRESRAPDEIERGNREQLARFGMENP